MKKKRRNPFLVPVAASLLVGLVLGYSLARYAPDLGAKLAGGRTASFSGLKALTSSSGTGAVPDAQAIAQCKQNCEQTTTENGRCPKPQANPSWSKETYTWCKNVRNHPQRAVDPGGPTNFWTCYNFGCDGFQGPGTAQQTGELAGFYIDNPAGVAYRSCEPKFKSCWESAKYDLPVTISGYVYEDLDTSSCCGGVRNPNQEKGIPGRIVTLTADWGSAGSTNVSATTNADGFFIFPYNVYALTGGRYRLSHEVPDGFVRTTDDSIYTLWGPGGKETHDFGVAKQ